MKSACILTTFIMDFSHAMHLFNCIMYRQSWAEDVADATADLHDDNSFVAVSSSASLSSSDELTLSFDDEVVMLARFNCVLLTYPYIWVYKRLIDR